MASKLTTAIEGKVAHEAYGELTSDRNTRTSESRTAESSSFHLTERSFAKRTVATLCIDGIMEVDAFDTHVTRQYIVARGCDNQAIPLKASVTIEGMPMAVAAQPANSLMLAVRLIERGWGMNGPTVRSVPDAGSRELEAGL